MGLFSWMMELFGSSIENSSTDGGILHSDTDNHCGTTGLDLIEINPANGLPMIGGSAGVDIEGNPYGLDSAHDHMGSSAFDDSWSSGTSSSFDDTWS